ncbi:nucleoid-associated protein [Pseudomonas aeruginosa]|uniref:nucleoid-associated protein n=1 Tax=Pseudomonas aeruginosa TaxID=287 RepID=UPI000EAB73B3|nr:nucleoid-associated protein [Pseudomonas aeruginosa]HCL3220631.1 nucleoid-associated protein [Pseudomonas aeruginosa]
MNDLVADQDYDDVDDQNDTAIGEFSIISAITASLERDKSLTGSPFKFEIGAPWSLTSPVSADFLEQINKKFKRKNKFHSYFSGNQSNQTPSNLKKYIDGEIEVEEFATLEMRLLVSIANDSERASLVGGNLVFIHYKTFGDDEDQGRLMIVMVDKKGAFEFDEKTLEPKKLQPIDTDALRQAALFDLTLFSVTYPKQEGAAYLHFIEGKSKAEFFKIALGCDSSVSNKESVNNIFEAIKHFSQELNLRNKVQQKITEKVYEYISERVGKEVSLKEIQNLIDKELPADHPSIGKFARFANENGFQVNAVFEATRHSLKDSVSIKISDFQSNYTLSAKASSIGYAGSGKPITVDDDLTYMKIPLSSTDRESLIITIGQAKTNDDESNS